MNNEHLQKNLRKKFLIYPQFQFRYLAAILIGSLTVVGIFFISNYYFFFYFEQKGISGGLPPDHVFFRFISEQRNFTALLSVGVAILTICSLGVYGLIQSHRIAGPLVRLKKYLQNEIDGKNTEPISFRKGDYFFEIADLINKALDKGRKPLNNSNSKLSNDT